MPWRALTFFFAGLSLALSAAPFHTALDTSGHKWSAVRGTFATDTSVERDGRASLRVDGAGAADVYIRSAPVALTIGKHYELSGWIRTAAIQVRDVERSPIATGAALSMASLPFDVHSESLGGTHDWTRVSLRFIATRPQDSIVLSTGNGGAFRGSAWFDGVSLDEVSPREAWPAREAVTTFGPAYRYPSAGWIYLHIEGKPYDRGYQHGYLMAREIPKYLDRCASDLGYKDDANGWEQARTAANALFLRGFDNEILQEMKGIADGASDAGARWLGRRLDVVDIVVANITVELGELRAALPMTPTGLEGLHLHAPDYARNVPITDRCSSFAATGPATRDGKMVIGHVTWWPLTLAEQTNVMLDIKPEQGHRMLIQSYPGGIESGTDWYQNDAGVVLTETTIKQSPFNAEGTPVAYRARKAIQYGSNIDDVVRYLSTRNNGLYTNEWLIGDAKTNEIAMFELGTKHTRLWRSSKNEWFHGTEGFYWGCNNAKDLNVRLEYQPDPQGAPEYVPFVPAPRDLAWQQFYRNWKGRIDEQFAFTAYRTAPLVSATTMDAKVITADMASRFMVWAFFGKPNEREWTPKGSGYAKNDGIYPSGYHLFTGVRPEGGEQAKPLSHDSEKTKPTKSDTELWHGWVLPASEQDTWFVAGSTAYYNDLRSDDLDDAMAAHWAAYRRLRDHAEDARERFELEASRGAIYLDALHHKLGDAKFFKLMSDYFAANTTKTVTAESFLTAAREKFAMPVDPGGPVFVARDIVPRLSDAILVYGTMADAGANRYAAERLQTRLLSAFERAVPIYKDFEVTPDLLRDHDVIFVGRPEANSALAHIAHGVGLDYDNALFRIAGKPYAYEGDALVYAAANPANTSRMFLVLAGNDALGTVKLARGNWDTRAQYAVFQDGDRIAKGYVR